LPVVGGTGNDCAVEPGDKCDERRFETPVVYSSPNLASTSHKWRELLLAAPRRGRSQQRPRQLRPVAREKREKQLIANKLDADGEVAESQAFDAPANWEVFDGSTLGILSHRQSGHGPTLRVNWPAQVNGVALDPLTSIEWIKYGDSFDDPKRLAADKASAYWDLELIWDADDAIYGMKSRLTEENGSVEESAGS
jgi:hypothetical protein